jgi:hypothetical protein
MTIRTSLAGAAMMLALTFANLTPADAAQGLNGRYYRGAAGNVAEAEAVIAGSPEPLATFTATSVCFPACGDIIGDDSSLSQFLGAGHYTDLSSDPFDLNYHVLELTGFLNIATAGTYSLSLGSDDGARLYIDGEIAVDGDFSHPFSYVSNDLDLSAGTHTIRLVQFEIGGGSGVSVLFNDEALSGDLISTTAAAAVPEPLSWAMMLGGFGLIGGALRRQRPHRVALA